MLIWTERNLQSPQPPSLVIRPSRPKARMVAQMALPSRPLLIYYLPMTGDIRIMVNRPPGVISERHPQPWSLNGSMYLPGYPH